MAAAALALRPPGRSHFIFDRVRDGQGLLGRRQRHPQPRELSVGPSHLRRRRLRRPGRLPGPVRRPHCLRQDPAERRVRLAGREPEQGAAGRLDAPHPEKSGERVHLPRARGRRQRGGHRRLLQGVDDRGRRAGPPGERRRAAPDPGAGRRRGRGRRRHVPLRLVGASFR